ncbi:MAG: PAS domain-containing sensor histidine kinase [Pedosphaera sp.]|nr:PAS domain-containing sensor histidine kinase [Pedosphaera sp.]
MAFLRQSLGLVARDRLIEEQRLAGESVRIFRTLFEASPLAILLLESGRVVDCNPAVVVLLGKQRTDLLGTRLEGCFPPIQSDGQESMKRWADQCEGGRMLIPQQSEWCLNHPISGAIECEVSFNRVIGVRGSLVQVILQDITARKRFEIQLKESEERFLSAFESSPALAAILTFEGVFLNVNQAFLRMLGFELQEISQQNFDDLKLWVNAREQARLSEALASASARNLECQVRAKDGSIRTLLVSTERLNVAGQFNLLMVALDISQRVQLESQLRRRKTLESVGLLSGGLAHDLNNILGVIMGNAQLAQMDLPIEHSVNQSMREILQASERAVLLMRQLTDFARPQSLGQRSLELSTALKETLQLLQSAFPVTITLRLEIKEPLPVVLGNENQLKEVLVNLATNARQAIESQLGNILISAESHVIEASDVLQLYGLGPGRYLRLKVTDDGKGMDPEMLQHIFDPFFTTRAPGLGSGMGLPTVYGIVQSHQGVIIARSSLGHGATFEIMIPEENREVRVTSQASSKYPMGAGQFIFYIDDETSLVSVATILLGRLGYGVQGFTNPQTALEALRVAPSVCQAVITDLTMPNLSGLNLAVEILKICPDMPILLSTGIFSEELLIQAQEIGIRAVISKPHTIEELASNVYSLFQPFKK